MMPGFGETLICEGDPRLDDERETLLREFRAQLDEGMWAAVPLTETGSGRREAVLVTDSHDIPDDADRLLLWPPAAGGSRPAGRR